MIDSISEQVRAGRDLRRKKADRRAPMADADRLPPHSEESEEFIVGCVLNDPSACLDVCREEGMDVDWFYDLRNKTAVEHALALDEEGKPWDVVVLYQRLTAAGLMEQIGGSGYLAACQNAAYSATALPTHLDIVREQWQMRTIIHTCTDVAMRVRDYSGDIESLLDEAQHDINGLSELRPRGGEIRLKQILLDKVMPKLESHYTRGRAQMNGLVTTGLEYLDKIFCGLGGDNGNFHVFAARPNVGKTSLLTGIALHAALDFEWTDEITEAEALKAEAAGRTIIRTEGKCLLKKRGVPVGISSLEMSSESLGMKMLFQRARADLQRWRTGFATSKDLPPLGMAAESIGKADNIFIDDTPRENIASIKAKWRRWHRQYGVRFFMLDYIQLIKSSNKRFRTDRVQEMEEICAEIQALGKELNCPMAILAQLNRDYEKEPNRLPRLSDLKNCGAIEQDADSVTLLYKPSQYKPFSKENTPDYDFFRECMEKKFGDNWKKWDGRPERINALIEKNKHGPKGDAKLLFLKSSTLFVDYTVWLKENNFKQAAKGEESRYRGEDELPTDDEIGRGK